VYPSVNAAFHQAAKLYANQPAVECGDRRLSYAELEERVDRLAKALIDSGEAEGAFLVILASKPFDYIVALIAAMDAGAVFAPLDARLPDARLKAAIAELSPKWIVVDSETRNRASQALSATASESKLLLLGEGELLSPGETPSAGVSGRVEKAPSVGPDELCYVFFTSGSTGRPKGIMGRRKGIDHFIHWEIETFGVMPGDRVSQLTSPSFDAVLRDIFTPLCAGGTVCAPESHEILLDPRRLSEWIDRSRLTHLHCVPSIFRLLAGQALDAGSFASLRYILMAGEPLRCSDVKAWMERFGDRVQLVNLYGPSETTMTKLFYLVKPEDQTRGVIPIGKPMAGAAAMIVDAHGFPVPAGAIGEIYLRTPFRTLGYLNQPRLTEELFIRNPYTEDPDDKIYKTGDYGRTLDDGNIEFLGRRDHQVKIRGVRVELGEIEAVLQEHEGVFEAAVVDREDHEGVKFLCGYLALKPSFDAASIRAYLAAHLPEPAIPSVFLELEALPRTITGKIDRQALPSPEPRRMSRSTEAERPFTPVEEETAKIWAETLRLQQVGLHDNFFELGGHSLMAFQIISRLSETFGVELPIRVFFDTLTVEGQALLITEALIAEESGLMFSGIGEEGPGMRIHGPEWTNGRALGPREI
jgi:amino acid adenylation domain-containing protein